MSNDKVLHYLEQNIEGIGHLTYFMHYDEDLTNELMIDIEAGRFSGCEYCLAIVLLAADDPVIDRARKRLILQWLAEEMKQTGKRKTVKRIAGLLNEERRNLEAESKRFRELND